MPRCPICGEAVSPLDREHVKMKHPEYFHESRKWVNASYLCVFSMSILVIIFFYFEAGNSLNFVANMILILMFVDVAIAAYLLGKMKRLASKYREGFK